MNRLPKYLLVTVAVATGVAVCAIAAFLASRPAPETMQGQVEATEVNVASKIAGRLATLAVRDGQRVDRGAELATLDSPEIRARLDQAQAAKGAAAAQRDKAYHGAREEEIRAAKNVWLRTQHATEFAEKTFRRVDRLNTDGVLPTQRRDEAEAGWKTAKDAEEAAKASYDMALKGARPEDKDAAAAMVDRASGAISEVEAFLAETRLVAPIAGEVYRHNVEPGEVVAAGYSVVTIVDLSDLWVTFNVREDRLAKLPMGRRITARVPALGGRDVQLDIYYIAPQGDFATWRATNAQGGFDLKTFEVRARPVGSLDGLRPGMSAVVTVEGTR
jgi:HlyD family secretion protein